MLNAEPLRFVYQDSHGQSVQMTGVPSVSPALATGLTVSGVEEATSRSMPSDKIAWCARLPDTVGLD